MTCSRVGVRGVCTELSFATLDFAVAAAHFCDSLQAEGEDDDEEEEEVDERGAPKRPTAEVFPSFEAILKPLHTAATDAILASLVRGP